MGALFAIFAYLTAFSLTGWANDSQPAPYKVEIQSRFILSIGMTQNAPILFFNNSSEALYVSNLCGGISQRFLEIRKVRSLGSGRFDFTTTDPEDLLLFGYFDTRAECEHFRSLIEDIGAPKQDPPVTFIFEDIPSAQRGYIREMINVMSDSKQRLTVDGIPFVVRRKYFVSP